MEGKLLKDAFRDNIRMIPRETFYMGLPMIINMCRNTSFVLLSVLKRHFLHPRRFFRTPQKLVVPTLKIFYAAPHLIIPILPIIKMGNSIFFNSSAGKKNS